MNTKFRALALIGIGRKIEDVLVKHGVSEPLGLVPSCISCSRFNEKEELCTLANARPPARVIAFSCEKYDDTDNIPF